MRRGIGATTVVSAFPAGRGDDATALVFEYMAATQGETGHAVPAGIDELPAVLQDECRNLPVVYQPPGALLIAGFEGQVAGCVGIAPCPAARTGEIKRLYVRPAYRGRGIAGTMMSHAHDHAARQGVTRLVLDVLPARSAVIEFYRRLGYTETEPYAAGSPVPMVFMERPITNGDLLATG